MNKNMIGTICSLIAATLYGSYGIWSRMMAGTFDSFFQGVIRAIIVLLILVPFVVWDKNSHKFEKKDLGKVLLYAIPGACFTPGSYFAYNNLTIGSATVLLYASLTISLYVIGVLFFKEKMTPIKITALILGIVGIVMTFEIGFNEDAVAAIVAILTGVCAAMGGAFTKTVSKKYTPLQLTTYMYIAVFVICLPGYYVLNGISTNIPSGDVTAWTGCIIAAIVSIVAFVFYVKGFELLEASVAGIIGLWELIAGVIFGLVLFDEELTNQMLYGSGLILISSMLPNIYIVYNKLKIKVKG